MAFWNRKKKKAKQSPSVTHVINNYGGGRTVRDQEPVTHAPVVNVYAPPVTPLFDGLVDNTSRSDDNSCATTESYTSHDSGSYDSGSSDSGSCDSGGSGGSD